MLRRFDSRSRPARWRALPALLLALASVAPLGAADDVPPGCPPVDPAPLPEGPRLAAWRGGELVPLVPPPGLLPGPDAPREWRLRARLDAVVAPPPTLLGSGMTSGWPAGARVVDLVEDGAALLVRLDLPESFLLGGGVTDEFLDGASRQILAVLQDEPGVKALHLAARDPRAGGRWTVLPAFLPAFDRSTIEKERVAEGDDPAEAPSNAPLVRRERLPPPSPDGERSHAGGTGFLSGKQVFLSQCHGWIDYDTADAWETQRGITNSIVEDFVNPEAANQYLVEYLRNAGATVWTLRESDLGTNLVIVDSADGTSFPANGTYVQSGSGAAFSTGTNDSFGNFEAPYTSSEDPLRKVGNKDRLIATAATETARATWTPVIPAEGDYNVYVSYTRDGTNRASDAHFIVRHTGGETHLRVNQERHGWVWVLLGRFHFAAGSNGATGSVVLANDSTESANTVSADAVRFGGGMGDIAGEYHGTLSGQPRWEEGARYYTQFQGASSSVWGSGDVACRSKFAAWENYGGGVEDSVYVSWHSNAFDGTARGTNSYIYSSNPPNGTYDPGQSATGSPQLMGRIHDELINDIRQAWDAAWQNRGYASAYFGEINPSYNNEMPSVLLEVAFHDNATDANALKDPRFRKLLARAVYQGIVKYFAQRDAVTARLLPEPPADPEVHSTSPTAILVSWLASPTDGVGVAGDAATSYRVYLSTDGRGWDEGTPAAGTSLAISGLAPGAVRFVRVTAENLGGESLPTETLVVRTPVATEPKVLVVGGFDRLDRSQLVSTTEPDIGAGTVSRMFLSQMNDFSYAVQHGIALASAFLAVDSASNEAVSSGRVALSAASTAAISWISGEESTTNETFSTTEQSRLTTYLSGGGRIFTSGAEIGWDLDWSGSTSDRAFYEGTVGANYVSDDAGVFTSDGVAGSALAGTTAIAFDDGTGPTYLVEYPDVLGTASGSTICLRYQPSATGAGIQYDAGTWRSVSFGFPFETIVSTSKRATVMDQVMKFLIPCVTPALAVTLSSAAEPSASSVRFTVGDTNPSQVTGWDLVRSSSASTSPGTWTAIVTNGADADAATAGVQLLDATGAAAPSGIWFYEARARNARCASTGPW